VSACPSSTRSRPELGHRVVNGGNVVDRSRRGIVLDSESRLETTSEKLGSDGGAGDGVKE
jgi:hypothetical protein